MRGESEKEANRHYDGAKNNMTQGASGNDIDGGKMGGK